MRPWARAPRRAAGTPSRCRCCPATAPRWQDLNQDALGATGTPSVDPGLRQAARRERRGRRRRACRWAARWCCGSPPTAPTDVAGVVRGQPGAVDHDRKDVLALPVLQAGGAVAPGHRQRHQEAGRGRARLHRAPPLKAAPLDDPGVARRSCPTCRRSPRRCCYFQLGRGPRRRRVVAGHHHRGGLLARRRPSGRSTDSYHVATLDNDAERSSTESADFVARVTASTPAEACRPRSDRRTTLSRSTVSDRARTTPGGSIVENYGDRPQLDDARRRPEPRRPAGRRRRAAGVRRRRGVDRDDDRDERFVPAAAAAAAPPDRRAAWPPGSACSASPARAAGRAGARDRACRRWLGYLLVGGVRRRLRLPRRHDAARPARPLATTAPGSDRPRDPSAALACARERERDRRSHRPPDGQRHPEPRPRRHPGVRRRLGDHQASTSATSPTTRPPRTITVSAEDDESLQRLLMRLQTRGVNQVDPGEADDRAWPSRDGVFPDGFYSTTNLDDPGPARRPVARRRQPRDGLRPGRRADDDGAPTRVDTLPMSDVQAGMQVVTGAAGIRVHVPVVDKSGDAFGFMESDVSSREAAGGAGAPGRRRHARGQGRRQEGAVGRRPGRRPHRRRAGHGRDGRRRASSTCCSPATRWPPTTSSRRSTAPSSASTWPTGHGVEHGHEHHIRALNTIRKEGSIKAAVDNGVLTGGIMHALVTHEQGVRARRLGPRRRSAARRLHRRHRGPARDARASSTDVGFCLMVATMLHSVATGNILPGLDPAGLRRHQPGHGHQARRPRLVARPAASSPTSGSSSSSSRSSSCPSYRRP